MKLLLCCEFYYPSVGGVQEVMRQLAERLVQRGHDVTVATTKLPNRDFTELNGVHIQEFSVRGNLVRSIEGEEKSYQDFVKNFPCDAILIKAAQQWTFDSLWPILDEIKARKIFIPCGFSGLYEPSYKGYFEDLPKILHQFDDLIFYADDYRDTNFARKIGYKNLNIIPNGASEVEFGPQPKTDFRTRHGIPKDSFVILTVGTLTGTKGHRELAEAITKLDIKSKHVTLILNGNAPITVKLDLSERSDESLEDRPKEGLADIINKKKESLRLWLKDIHFSYIDLPRRALRVLFVEGWSATLSRVSLAFQRIVLSRDVGPLSLKSLMDQINKNSRKKVLLLDLPRTELIEAYQEADLFVFASIIEYSPLVLFEAAASGTPFLSVPVGNSEEIALWTQGGVICPAKKDKQGYTRVDTQELADHIKQLINSPELLAEMGKKARARWEKYFSWDKITDQYEAVLQGKQVDVPVFLKDYS
ncbi:glycosyltransferase family 4 protein [Polynucleobacter paneuropaeus]|nr:glycosyltransferase family 4 protein [Polynucleobacter paneuropaeus]